jgi:hypothetical protein
MDLKPLHPFMFESKVKSKEVVMAAIVQIVQLFAGLGSCAVVLARFGLL